MKAWAALEAGKKRLALAWHRRYGKDEVSLNWTAVSAMTRVGTYWHLLPQQAQARKAIWNAVDESTGVRRIDKAFPLALREKTVDNEMFIRFKNGSTWQVVGSDNYNSLVGAPPVGVVLSEYALSDPNAWSFLRPILVNNGGWAMFISTPRGNNHFAKLVRYAMENPDDWFGQVLTVEDTGAIPMEMIERERRELRAERGEKEADAIVAQEYYCDFNAAIPGAYYGAHMTAVDREGRLGDFPWITSLPVGTAWDIGHSDSTVIWFFQQLASGRIRLIDVLEGSGVGIDWYAAKLRERQYAYADHIWPHDGGHGNIRDIGGTSLEANAKAMGVRPIRVLERDQTVQMGIQAVRQAFPMLEFNAKPLPFLGETQEDANARMSRACDALRQYRRVWDEKNQRMSDNPLHDWTSNTADSLRYLARGRKPFFTPADRAARPQRAITDD